MIRPVDIWIVAEKAEKQEELSSGGIVIMKHAVEEKHKAKVLAVGPNVKIDVKVGDTIVFGRYAGDEFEGKMLIKEDEIMAVVE